MQGAGCRVQGAGCRVQGAGYRVQGAGCSVQCAGYRVQGAGCRVQGAGRRVQGAGCRVQGAGYRVQGAGCRGGALTQPKRGKRWPDAVSRRASHTRPRPLCTPRNVKTRFVQPHFETFQGFKIQGLITYGQEGPIRFEVEGFGITRFEFRQVGRGQVVLEWL